MMNYNNIMFNDDIKKFIENVNDKINHYNDLLTVRNRKIDFTDLIFFLIKYNMNKDYSYNSTCIDIYNNNESNDVSYQAYINKRNNIDIDVFIDINNSLIKSFYEFIKFDKVKQTTILNKRIISCDGSQLNFLYSLNDNFKSNKHDTYTYVNLSCLYDVDLKMPIDYLIGNEDERSLLINQFNKLTNDDILVADRGYYSNDIVNKLSEKNINFCLRITKQNKYYIDNKNLIDNSTNGIVDVKQNNRTLKLFWYKTRNKKDVEDNIEKITNLITTVNNKINNKKNNLLIIQNEYDEIHKENKKLNEKIKKTKNPKSKSCKLNVEKLSENRKIKNTLNEKKSINQNEINELKEELKKYYEEKNEINLNNNSIYLILTNLDTTLENIKEIYKKRWEVEIHFRFAKQIFKLDKMNNKNVDYIKQNLLITQFAFILESYMEYILNKKIDKTQMINKTSAFTSLKNKLLYLIFFDKSKNKINKIIALLIKLLKTIFKIIKTIEYKKRIRKRPQKNHYNTNIK